ncbi:MAG: translation elongation factor Ts [Legionellales bacterium]|nr:translation elongation factor Ts [Legionellales bacterium]
MTISATMVMELRGRTGAGMMECKKFLIATQGDIEQAIIEMRKAGQAKADKKADRVAAEGVIVIARSLDGRRASMLEVNSETDFVARDGNFLSFANQVAETALQSETNDVTILAGLPMKGFDLTVEEARQALVAKIGENVKVRRVQLTSCEEGIVGCYSHGSRIGVAVAIENERDIFTALARESGKPQEIVNKMIEGRISKFIDEVSLLGQPFVKDPNLKVGQLLKNQGAEVLAFTRFEVGEGIEKKEDNFVEEVMAQVREQ